MCVSWNDAQAFIAWLAEQTGETYRLPTEAEWEYAARAGSTTKYHFGNSDSQLCRYANHADTITGYKWRNKSCSDGVGKRTASVGRYQPNSYGLYDMHGNVNEWVQDCWNDSYAGAPSDGRAGHCGDCSRRGLRGRLLVQQHSGPFVPLTAMDSPAHTATSGWAFAWPRTSEPKATFHYSSQPVIQYDTRI